MTGYDYAHPSIRRHSEQRAATGRREGGQYWPVSVISKRADLLVPLAREHRATALQERAEVVLSFAQVLHVNGQSTEETVAAAKQAR